jgi:hypothetical protein
MRLIGLILLFIHLVACGGGSDSKPSNTQKSSVAVVTSSIAISSSSISSSSTDTTSTSNSTSSSAAYTLDSYDWGQTVVTNNTKLIPNKSALLRLHILSSQATPVPDIQVEAILNSTTTLPIFQGYCR